MDPSSRDQTKERCSFWKAHNFHGLRFSDANLTCTLSNKSKIISNVRCGERRHQTGRLPERKIHQLVWSTGRSRYDTEPSKLDASTGCRVSLSARRWRQRRMRASFRHEQMSISCAVPSAELHSAFLDDKRMARDVPVQIGASCCLNFDLELCKSRTPSPGRVVSAHELFVKEDDYVDDPMSPALIPTVLLLKRCLKRLSGSTSSFGSGTSRRRVTRTSSLRRVAVGRRARWRGRRTAKVVCWGAVES